MSDVPPTGEPVPQDRPFAIEVAERVRRLPPYLFAQINRLMYEKRRAGDDVIDLGMGNPSDPPQDLVIEKLAEAARDPKNHGYSEAHGHPQPAAGGGRQVFQGATASASTRSAR